ncbi:hypothetical protein VPH35_062510 [Triticum aestivum]
MNPHPAAAARTSCTTSTYFLGDPERLIDLPGLLGLIDRAHSLGGSGPRRAGPAIHKKAPLATTSPIEHLPVGGAAARWSPGNQPRPSWSLKNHYGDPLFEIFGVYANFPLVGQVLASGGMVTDIICQLQTAKPFYSLRARWAMQHPKSQLVDFRMKLPPTGPCCYISACSGVALGVKIDATKNNAEEVSSLVRDWDDDSPTSDKCNTVSIETSKGVVDVVCAVISDAVELGLCVRMCIPSCEPAVRSASVYGSITARPDMFDPKITIFTRDAKSAINLLRRVAHPVPHFLCAESYRHVTLPLARTFLAVPTQATRVDFEWELAMVGGSKTIGVTQSIPIDAEEITTPWVKHRDCYTSLSMCVHRAR